MLGSNEEALEVIMEAITAAGHKPGDEIMIALDPAATEFYKNGQYVFEAEGAKRNAEEMVQYYTMLVEKYPIISIEDGLAEDDWEGWLKLTEALGKRIQIVGDDLFVTNTDRLVRGIESGVANSILIKLNQISISLKPWTPLRWPGRIHCCGFPP